MKLSDFDRGAYQVGQVVGARGCTYEKRKTEPPRRYTQGDLMDDMIAAHKFAKDEQERAVLRQIAGLGTSRTREPTITGLIDRGFLEVVKEGRGRSVLRPTAMAREVTKHLPTMLTSVATTARWELVFRLVEEGKATAQDVDKYLGVTLKALVDEARKVGSIKVEAPAAKAAARNPFKKSAAATA